MLEIIKYFIKGELERILIKDSEITDKQRKNVFKNIKILKIGTSCNVSGNKWYNFTHLFRVGFNGCCWKYDNEY
jgi:hypothetical protein